MHNPINIVLFWFMSDWGKYGRAYEQIATHLSKRPDIGRVLCVLPPNDVNSNTYSWPISVFHSTQKLWAISISSQPCATTGFLPGLRKSINRHLPCLCYRLLLKALGFKRENTLLWLYPPHPYIPHVETMVPHSGRVVQIVDNNMHLEDASEEYRLSSKQQYETLVTSADCVIVSSQANCDYFSKINSRTYLFENAVEASFLRAPTELPCRLFSSRPRLGYVGWISERTDVGLLEVLALNRPEYDIVLAGPVTVADVSRLKTMPNVYLLGNVAHDKVPDLISSFDVCLIPHHDTAYSRSMSPLKLFQYLGSGRPIVSTPVAGVDRWAEHVLIADGVDDFILKVDLALREETLAKAQARISAVTLESWEIRIEQILQAVIRSTQ